jgi:hypothetical protein
MGPAGFPIYSKSRLCGDGFFYAVTGICSYCTLSSMASILASVQDPLVE